MTVGTQNKCDECDDRHNEDANELQRLQRGLGMEPPTLPNTTYTRANPRYVVAIRSYFDKQYGNSYFTGRIYGSGEEVYLPMQYGHGDSQYRHAALQALGIDKPNDLEAIASLVGVEVANVSRIKDLHNGGR